MIQLIIFSFLFSRIAMNSPHWRKFEWNWEKKQFFLLLRHFRFNNFIFFVYFKWNIFFFRLKYLPNFLLSGNTHRRKTLVNSFIQLVIKYLNASFRVKFLKTFLNYLFNSQYLGERGSEAVWLYNFLYEIF